MEKDGRPNTKKKEIALSNNTDVTATTTRGWPPNQSLKLTEPAVDDFARAKQPVTIGLDLARADWIPSLRHFVAAA